MTLLLSDIQSAVRSAESEPQPSAREKLILGHALEAFVRFGYAGTNLRAIAGAAGLTAPMVNYYFATKESLYQRLAAVVMLTLDAEVDSGVAAARDDLADALRNILRAHVTFAERYPDGLAFLLALTYGPIEGRPSVDLEPFYANVQRRVRLAFDRSIRVAQWRPRNEMSAAAATELFAETVDVTILRVFKARRFGKAPPSFDHAEHRLQRFLAVIGWAGDGRAFAG